MSAIGNIHNFRETFYSIVPYQISLALYLRANKLYQIVLDVRWYNVSTKFCHMIGRRFFTVQWNSCSLLYLDSSARFHRTDADWLRRYADLKTYIHMYVRTYIYIAYIHMYVHKLQVTTENDAMLTVDCSGVYFSDSPSTPTYQFRKTFP